MKTLLDTSLLSGMACGDFFDRTGHAPGALSRGPHDAGCRALVFHRIGEPQSLPSADALATLPAGETLGGEGRDVDGIIQFFTQHPEGVATVTLDGTYDEKRPKIEAWTRDGVPADVAARAFVPYTFLIALDGSIHQMLRLDATGAHARGFNQSGYGIAFLGDFRFEDPTPAQIDAGVAVGVALLRQLRLSTPPVQLLSHDEARRAIGQGPKACTGPRFPLEPLRARIRELCGR